MNSTMDLYPVQRTATCEQLVRAEDILEEYLDCDPERPLPGDPTTVLLECHYALCAARNALRDGLEEELAIDAPWLSPRAEQLGASMERAADRAYALAEWADGTLEIPHALRGHIRRLLMSLRRLRAFEHHLLFERFDEPPALD